MFNSLLNIKKIELLIKVIDDKLVRGSLHVVSKQVRMDLNHIYRENEDGSLVVFYVVELLLLKLWLLY